MKTLFNDNDYQIIKSELKRYTGSTIPTFIIILASLVIFLCLFSLLFFKFPSKNLFVVLGYALYLAGLFISMRRILIHDQERKVLISKYSKAESIYYLSKVVIDSKSDIILLHNAFDMFAWAIEGNIVAENLASLNYGFIKKFYDIIFVQKRHRKSIIQGILKSKSLRYEICEIYIKYEGSDEDDLKKELDMIKDKCMKVNKYDVSFNWAMMRDQIANALKVVALLFLILVQVFTDDPVKSTIFNLTTITLIGLELFINFNKDK